MSELVIEVQSREKTGKNHNRRLRAAGEVPAVVYGSGLDPAAIQVDRKTVDELLRKTEGDNPVFLLKLAGTDKSRHCMIRELLTDPITGSMLHIDFQRIDLKKEVHVSVQIELHGTPVGVKTDGGMLDFVTRELEIWALPNSIPPRLDLDVSELLVGQHVEAGQVELPEGVRLETEPERVVVSIHGKAAAEEDEVEEDELGEPERIGGAAEE